MLVHAARGLETFAWLFLSYLGRTLLRDLNGFLVSF